MSENELKLYVDGQIFTGWQTVEVTRNVDSISGQFNVTLIDKWRESATSWPIAPGKPVKVFIDNDRVLTGYIDDLSPEYDENTRTIKISGRDKSGDLVDCSAVPGEYLNQKADAIAKRLLAPFGIEIKVETDVGEKFPKWSVKCGESVFENLERLGKLRGLFFISDEYAVVRIQKRSDQKSTTRLEQGVNIKTAKAKYDNSNRFSFYKILGQHSGSDNQWGDATIRAKAESHDSGIDRYRPMIIVAEGNTNQKTAVQRANWELATRIAKAVSISVTLFGWRQRDGSLWKVNQLVDLNAPFLGITNTEMLISSVQFKKDKDAGTTTQMELVRKESFLPEPEVLKENDPVEGVGW